MEIEKYYNYKLCYVDQEDEYSSITTLYFTNDMEKQWGDDWEDAPYEHNAEPPYENETDIYSIIIEHCFSDICTPMKGYSNSPYSVKDINEGIVPWITIPRKEKNSIFIKAGDTLFSVIDRIKSYLPKCKIYAQLKEED